MQAVSLNKMLDHRKSICRSLFLIIFIKLNHFSTITLVSSAQVFKNLNHFAVGTRNTITVTSIKCVSHDSSFLRYEECYIKPVNRNMKTLNIRALLLQKPVVNIDVHVRTFKRANGYKPFIISADWEACKILAGRRNLLFSWGYDILAPYTNINHSCPYNHDIIVDKLPLNNITLPSLFPEGDYRLNVDLEKSGTPRSTMMLFLTIKEIFKSQ